MQTSLIGTLDLPSHTQHTYHFCYLECSYIGAEGCRYLSKGQWTNLQILNLSISYTIQRRTISKMKDAGIYQMRPGSTSKYLTYVPVVLSSQQQYRTSRMQAFIRDSLEQSQNTLPKYHVCNLGTNNFGAEGCSHLSRAQWSNLLLIDLCTSCVIQLTTLLELKDAGIWQSLSGLTSKYSTYVSFLLFRE